MAHTSTMAAASAAPFNPAAWVAKWTAIGGAYARTDAGLFLFWHEVDDNSRRSELLEERASDDATRELWLFLDPERNNRTH